MASTKKMNTSTSIFQQRLETIRPQIFLPETEETWDTIARGIANLAAACNETDSYTPADLLAAMRSISRPLISAMNSERGRLSGIAIDLVAMVASCLGVAFEPLLSHFLPVLLALSGRTSKVTVSRARTCILTIIDATHLPSILSYLLHDVADKSVSLRLAVQTARDANADIRKVSRKVFEAYKLLLPSRLETFTTPLTPTTRKYLDIRNKIAEPKASHSHLPPPSKPALLSSSTSAMRGPSSRRPPTHTRSASSPAVGPDADVPGDTGEHPPRSRSRAKAEMLPPKLPESAQPSRQPVTVRPTSAIERKRVVSMSAAVRPAVPITKSDATERARPAPVSNLVPGRSQPVVQATKATSVVARRVPVSEVQKSDREKAVRAHPRIDTSASTPAIRLASVSVPAVAGDSKPPIPRVARTKDGDKALVKPKAKESNWTKPTLSQISRAKTIERRVPVPAVSRFPRPKTAPHKPVPTGKSKLAAPTTTITPDEQIAPSASTSSLVALEPQSIEEEVNEEASAVAATEEVVMRPETPASETNNTGHDETRITVTITESPSDSSNPTTPPKAEKRLRLSSEEQNEDSGEVGDKGFELVPRLESRRALGDVAINK
ncbi:hypothetical protein B0H14DRAFT_2668046 [Mycena olivaceomarginata]|nr:hypothetical protein B0H14DRAFT_2668046 [Mycena olivaceomarginata]